MLDPLLSHAVTRSFTYDETAELFPLQVVLLIHLCVRLQSLIQSAIGYECHSKSISVKHLDLYLLETSLVTGATQLNLKLCHVFVSRVVDEVIRQKKTLVVTVVVVAVALVS